MLERASVVGRSFSLAAVLELIQEQERELAQSRLFDLARKGLIRPDISDPRDRLPLPARPDPGCGLRIHAEDATR